jgi:hypothetical protein
VVVLIDLGFVDVSVARAATLFYHSEFGLKTHFLLAFYIAGLQLVLNT